MGSKKVLHRFAGMVSGAILDQDDVLLSLVQDFSQKGGIAAAGEAFGLALPEEAPGDVVDQAKDFVAFAFTAGHDERLLAFGRPGVTERTPLGETGFIAEENQRTFLLSEAHNGRPRLLVPLRACRFIQVIRGKTCLLKRKAQLVQQLTDVVRMIRDLKGAQEQILDQHRTPTRRGVARRYRAGFDQFGQLLSLCLGQLGWSPCWLLIQQTRHTPIQKRIHIIAHRLLTQVQHGRYLVYRLAFYDGQQSVNPPHQPHLPALVGLLQPLAHSLTQITTKTYPDVHERCLLSNGFRHPSGSHLSVLLSTFQKRRLVVNHDSFSEHL
jgi:hypothetical protein